jgi:hypothetical protein
MKRQWIVNESKAQVDAIVKGKPVPVCKMLWPTKLRSEAETRDNANLIAAAPNLLDAVHDLLDMDTHDDPEERSAIFSKARAAIAKAKGEQP